MNIFGAKVAPLTRFIFFYSSARNGWDAWNSDWKHFMLKVCSTCCVDMRCRAGTKLRDANFDAKEHIISEYMIHSFALLTSEFEWTSIFFMSFLLDYRSFWGPGKRVKNEKSHSFEIEALKVLVSWSPWSTKPTPYNWHSLVWGMSSKVYYHNTGWWRIARMRVFQARFCLQLTSV